MEVTSPPENTLLLVDYSERNGQSIIVIENYNESVREGTWKLRKQCDQEDVRWREQHVQRPCGGRTCSIPETGGAPSMSRAW